MHPSVKGKKIKSTTHNQKILIVEDELAYSKLLHDQLSAKGYTVIDAVDGKNGLKKAKTENPDLILLDIIMPVMDGMTMLNSLRKQEESKNTKVIMLTNLEPDEQIIEKVISDQPTYYFVKNDIHFNDLVQIIDETLAA